VGVGSCGRGSCDYLVLCCFFAWEAVDVGSDSDYTSAEIYNLLSPADINSSLLKI